MNPFVYAFSNRAIRRAFRQVICRRFCCYFWFLCRNKSDQPVTTRRQRAHSGSLTTETSQLPPRRTSSLSADALRNKPKVDPDGNLPAVSVFRGANTGAPAVSFADFLAQTAEDEKELPIEEEEEKSNRQTLVSDV